MFPIIVLWAHPRSMSTAIEGVMRERGDFDCLHEPFLHYYYLRRSAKKLPHFDKSQDHPRSFAETRDMILRHAEAAPVFIKDMSYYVIPELLEDPEFCLRPRHCFLIRNPLRAIMSYYKIDRDVRLDEIGIEAQWLHFQGLKKQGINNSLVLEAESVQADTPQTLSRFWQALEVDFKQQALSWQQDSIPEDWQYVQGWYRSVSDSQGIRESSTDEVERAGAEFSELCQQAPQLAEYLKHHLPFYESLREHSLTRKKHGS